MVTGEDDNHHHHLRLPAMVDVAAQGVPTSNQLDTIMYHGDKDFDNYGEDDNHHRHHCHLYLPVVDAAAQGLPTSNLLNNNDDDYDEDDDNDNHHRHLRLPAQYNNIFIMWG